MRKVYRLKHKPTGLYWVKKSYSHLSETGSVYTSGNHAFSGCSPKDTINVCVSDDKMIRRHLDVLSTVGTIQTYPVEKWDSDKGEFVPTGKTRLRWFMKSKVSDFEKEFVTLEPEVPEPSVDNKQELIRKIADICFNHRVNPDIETFDEWLNLIQDELKEQ